MKTKMKTQQEINEAWTRSSENYDRIILDELNSFRTEAWQKQIMTQVEEGRKLKILDTGCGPAFFTIILSKLGHEVTGIDGAGGMLERARKNIELTGVEAEIMEMDCHELTFEDNTFDLIVSRNVTHALRDHVQVYRQWQRVLKPGGVLLIFDANWHLMEQPGDLHDQYIKDLKRCIEVFGSDFNGHTDPSQIEDWSADKTHLLGDTIRPDWDMGILKALNYKDISCDRDITGPLWDEKEKTIYATTPMFMIRAVK